MSSPGPHAFILVLNITTRFTRGGQTEVEQTVQHFVKYFGEEIYKYFIILFTRKEELDKHQLTLKQYIDTSQGLKSFIAKCGGQVLTMDNTLKDEAMEEQVKELLNIFLQNVEKNSGEYYSNDMNEKAAKYIR